MPRDESRDVVVNQGMNATAPWAHVSQNTVATMQLYRYVPHSHLPPLCATCRHRIKNGDNAMFWTKIHYDTPDDGHCHLHTPKDSPDAP
jgi:hypothetical protein